MWPGLFLLLACTDDKQELPAGTTGGPSAPSDTDVTLVIERPPRDAPVQTTTNPTEPGKAEPLSWVSVSAGTQITCGVLSTAAEYLPGETTTAPCYLFPDPPGIHVFYATPFEGEERCAVVGPGAHEKNAEFGCEGAFDPFTDR